MPQQRTTPATARDGTARRRPTHTRMVDSRFRDAMLRAMSRHRHQVLALCTALLLAVVGLLGLMACDCHADDHGAHEHACACDCVCCGAPLSALAAAPGCDAPARPMHPAAVHPAADGDTGRLTESFIFTPPRA